MALAFIEGLAPVVEKELALQDGLSPYGALLTPWTIESQLGDWRTQLGDLRKYYSITN